MRGVAEQEADKVVFVGTYGNRLRRRVTPWALVCNVRRYSRPVQWRFTEFITNSMTSDINPVVKVEACRKGAQIETP